MKRNLSLFIDDILESVKAIEEFSKKMDKNELISNRLKQSAIIREIEIIGEAVKNIPKSFREKYPNIEWNKIAGTRDIIIHGYFKVDLNAVWEIIKKEIPKLKKQILKIKEKESHQPGSNAL